VAALGEEEGEGLAIEVVVVDSEEVAVDLEEIVAVSVEVVVDLAEIVVALEVTVVVLVVTVVALEVTAVALEVTEAVSEVTAAALGIVAVVAGSVAEGVAVSEDETTLEEEEASGVVVVEELASVVAVGSTINLQQMATGMVLLRKLGQVGLEVLRPAASRLLAVLEVGIPIANGKGQEGTMIGTPNDQGIELRSLPRSLSLLFQALRVSSEVLFMLLVSLFRGNIA